MTTNNSTPPDMIAQAGELLSMLQHGRMIADWGIEDLAIISQADSAIVIASAVLAVAGEIRELRNVLAMSMSEGTDMNGAPASALRIDTGA